jgi:DMSO/TMAO reductase YedYZ molybdopterin-dependent catalytic subunit
MSGQQRNLFCRRIILVHVLFGFLAATPVVFAGERPHALHVDGQVAQPSDWPSSRLEKNFAADMQTVPYTSHGQQHSAKCVALVTLLKAAGVQTELKMDPKADPKAKNYPLRFVVLVAGRDGYSTAFSLGELMPEVGHAAVWLAVEVDGKPLAGDDGPARLIVPADGKPARNVHGVGTITIIDTTKAATTQPG